MPVGDRLGDRLLGVDVLAGADGLQDGSLRSEVTWASK